MSRVRTFKYSLEGCVFALLAALSLLLLRLFFVNTTITNYNSSHSNPFISIISIFLKAYDQTYYKWYELNVNVVRILIATCTYKSTS